MLSVGGGHPRGAEDKVEAFLECLAEPFDATMQEEYILALEGALRERLRVNVGLLAENTELKRRLAG